jgi:hypothetical protein
MPLPFSYKQLRCLLKSRDRAEDTRQIAAKTAHQCLDKVIKRLKRDCESWSAAQLRGYLRATAIPWIDSALEEILKQNHRMGGFATQVRSLSLDILEQQVVEKLQKQPAALSSKSAAA